MHTLLNTIKNGAQFALDNPNAPYDFARDDKNGQACEQLSYEMIKSRNIHIERCVKSELTKDFIGVSAQGTPFELEVKGDYKSIIFGNLFLEAQNTHYMNTSGIMCGNSTCVWHHYFFTPNDCTKLHLLNTTKGFLRDLMNTYLNTTFVCTKTIPNARGYAVAQSLFTEELLKHPQYLNRYNILTFNL